MIEIKPLTDLKTINSIMSNEFLKDDICDDASEDSVLLEIPSFMKFHGVYKDSNCVGFYATHLQNSSTVEIHTCLLPEFRGREALQSGRLILSILFNDFDKIISWIPEYNKKALIYSKLLGLSIEGENRFSFKKNDILYHQYLVGITKGEFSCQ
jgi:hypothetical protein